MPFLLPLRNFKYCHKCLCLNKKEGQNMTIKNFTSKIRAMRFSFKLNIKNTILKRNSKVSWKNKLKFNVLSNFYKCFISNFVHDSGLIYSNYQQRIAKMATSLSSKIPKYSASPYHLDETSSTILYATTPERKHFRSILVFSVHH